ncbi:uncharacterized protein DUF1127 [Hasllibacter halocynthiae]|uniref:Uncharacterized protein DUF1127 n=1 Tax=Hasllibacter halocynthiae TaxID=595589 RepID=A0A2T0X8C7_9RHOB|nr:DUF1127 domain-containing protein [Hasllibacter halocynthiae]PRY95198.1 uncharacterized protein DUF1127 [Hasllibacter halocynthiae]
MFAPHTAALQRPVPGIAFGPFLGAAKAAPGILLAGAVRWDARWRARRTLGALPAGHLADMGIDPRAARREAARPIWEA